jgi:hypothetical protein
VAVHGDSVATCVADGDEGITRGRLPPLLKKRSPFLGREYAEMQWLQGGWWMKEPERKHGKGTCKVISLRGWREGKKLEETLGNGLFYQSLVVDQRGGKAEDDPNHFEIAYTLSSEELPEDERFIQIGEEEIFSPIPDQEGNKLVPFNQQVIERYEFYDLNTDDIHVIYRIPRRPTFR